MYKLAFLTLLVLYGSAQAYVRGNHDSRASLLYEIARLMQTQITANSVDQCDATQCCAVVTHSDGTKEDRVINEGQSVSMSEDGCKRRRCTNGRLEDVDITNECRKIDKCPDGQDPVRIGCCPGCAGQLTEGTCQVTEWGQFGPCSVTCGGGQRARLREAINLDRNVGFVNCTALLVDFENCSTTGCPKPCLWREEQDGECPDECVGGEIRKYFVITQQPENGGAPCPPDVVRNETTIVPCCQDCEYINVTENECLPNCGGGIIKHYFKILKQPVNGGKQCPDEVVRNETVIEECCQDCEWIKVTEDECIPDCGGGIKREYYKILKHPLNGGAPCPDVVLRNETVIIDCCRPCKYEMVKKGECLPDCGGGGIEEIYYIITQEAAGGGMECPEFVRKNITTVIECCENCVWEYRMTPCSVTCGGGGSRTKYQFITKPPINGGTCEVVKNETINCPPLPPCITCDGKGEKPCPLENGTYICICVINDNCNNPDQRDQDFDGVRDACDNCIFSANPTQTDSDSDGIGNKCDPDDDNDGHLDQNDNCPTVVNSDQKDTDRDRVGDACDNCITKSNNNQADVDKDGAGNACDNCRFHPNPDQDPGDPAKFGTLCTTRPSTQAEFMEEDVEDEEESKKSLIVNIMERLMKMYYGN